MNKWQAQNEDLSARLSYYKGLQEYIKGLGANVAPAVPVQSEAVNTPATENEAQPITEAATGEPVGNSEQLNQSEENLEMDAHLINEVSKENTLGRSLSEQEAQSLIAEMENNAEVAPEIDLTIDNWDALFGEDGTVNTPIGEVKMGENQFTKLMRQDRNGKLGMIKPTLENPDAIIEDKSKAKEGDTTERASSYVFVKAFKKADGTRYYYFTSVTVSKDNKEVVISNQEKRRNAIANLLVNGKLVWKHADNVSSASDVANGLYSSQVDSSELATEGTDAPQTNGTISTDVPSSADESTTQSANSQENSVKSGENTQNEGEKDVIAETREQNRVAEERQQRAGVPPRVSDYSSAINAEDTEAQKAWEDKFNDFLAKLTIDDLPTIDSTISSMQGNKEAIKAGDPGGYKENPHYKAFDYIETALKRRKRELEKSSTNGSEETAQNASQQSEPAEEISFSKLKELFDSFNDDEYLAVLFDRVIKVAETANIKIILKPLEYNVAGNYRPAVNTVFLNSDFFFNDTYGGIKQEKGKKANTIVHELIHSVTAYAVTYDYLQRLYPAIRRNSEYQVFEKNIPQNLKRAAAELYNVFYEVRASRGRKAEFGTIVGFNNPMEFIAEIGKKKFREGLKKIGLWRRIVDGIKKFFRVANDEAIVTNALQESETVLEELLSNFDLVAHKSFIDFDKKVLKAELQRGSLSLDGENPAFKAATEKTMQALENTGVEVVMATEEQVKAMMGIANAERQMIADANERFNRELQQQIDGTLPKGHVYKLGMPSAILQSAGLPYLPIELASSRLSDKSMQENHPFELSEIEGLVEGVQNPLAVFRSATHVGSFVVLTEIQHNGRNFVAAIETNRRQGRIEINSVRSVHYRNSNTHIANWIVEGLLEYADKKRMSEWFSKQQYNSADVRNLFRHSAKIVESFENPKIEAEFSRVFHGSGAKFDRFDHSFMGTGEGAQAYGWGTYVTEVEGIGRTYATSVSRGKVVDYEETSEAIAEDLENKIGLPLGTLFVEYDGKRLRLDVAKYDDAIAKTLSEYTGIPKTETDAILYALGEDAAELIDKYLYIGQRNLYTVEIPDDNGSNYLHWEEPINGEVQERIANGLQSAGFEIEPEMNHLAYSRDGKIAVLNINAKGKDLYAELSDALGSDKAASEFLSRAGFVGISYPAEATTGGRKDNARNYVIFNENDAQITERVEFLRTSNGTVYGWTVNGRIFLTPEGVNPNTPVHEYTHLWASAIEQRDPNMWRKIVEAMKQSPVWNEVMADEAYRNIWNDENRVASEVLSRLSGNENYRRTMEEAAKREADPAKKFELIAAWGRVKRALTDFWNWVKKNVFKAEDNAPWQEFVNSVVGDFYKGVNPNVQNSPMEGMFIGENTVNYTAEEQQIIDRAKADGTYMKAPNEQPTKLSPKQWAQVRTKAFKKWFGDWEIAAMETPIFKSKGTFANLAEAEKWAKENLQGQSRVNKFTGEEISVSRQSVNEMLAPKFTKAVNEHVHISALRSVLDFIETGIPAEVHADTHGRDFNVMRLYNAVEIDGKVYRVKSTVKKVKEGDKYYTYEIQEMELLEDTQNALGLLNAASGGQLNSNNSITGAKLLNGVKKTNSNDDILQYSKVVDENGEPKILEHSTWNDDFYTFDIERLGESSGDEGIYGAGFYFGNVGRTQLYGDRAIHVYLNMKKPMFLPKSDSMTFFNYLIENFDKKELHNIEVKGDGKTTTLGKVIDAIKDVQANYENGEYSELIEAIRDIWSTPENVVIERKIFDKLGFVLYTGIAPFIEENIGRREFSAALLNAGYDGIVFDNREWVVFKSNQIKSATDNVGTFSNENNDIRFRSVGGNSGYVGYSMSKRAAEARQEGRYPKTDFNKNYGVAEKTLKMLVEAGIINNREWHHTSKYGNETIFYSWNEPEYAEYYKEHKKEIDKAVKEIEKLKPSSPAIDATVEEYKLYLRNWGDYAAKTEAFRRDLYDEFYDARAKEIDSLNEGLTRIDSEITSAVNTLATELNTDVEIVNEVKDIPDARKRGAKGWYENGRVYIVLPNATSVDDAVETVLHEVVGHKGLRALFGREFAWPENTFSKYYKKISGTLSFSVV